ncbi:MAG TPA: hypothetical protein VKH42_09650 [Vicinamibacterales bacterium]|nr:hypothetical protein [Vicinamibacterales bacterium]
MDSPDYCREIEAYLCRKNDGHLIRITGPSFELVLRWAELGIPVKVAFSGIDRCFERYYRQGPRRRPLKIDFCDADVLDVFDDWRRAVGQSPVAGPQSPVSSRQSLPAHLERVVTKLTAARAKGALGSEFDAARASAGGLRGAARQAAIDRLAAIDAELLQRVRATLPPAAVSDLEREAGGDLQPFRAAMAADAYARAKEAAVDQLVRERFGLPTIVFP